MCVLENYNISRIISYHSTVMQLKDNNVVTGRFLRYDLVFSFFFFFKQKTAYEIASCLVGSEMCIRDSELLGFLIHSKESVK